MTRPDISGPRPEQVPPQGQVPATTHREQQPVSFVVPNVTADAARLAPTPPAPRVDTTDVGWAEVASIVAAEPTAPEPTPVSRIDEAVARYNGKGTIYTSAIEPHEGGVEAVVGHDQEQEVVAGMVLPALRNEMTIDVIDMRRMTEKLIEEAGDSIRVVDAPQLLHMLPPKAAVAVAAEVLQFEQESAREYASGLLDEILNSLQKTADARNDMNPKWGDVVEGLKFLRTRSGELPDDYKWALDKAELLSTTDRQTKADQLANLEAQLSKLHAQGGVVAPEMGGIHSRISTVWRMAPNPSSRREDAINNQILFHATFSLLNSRELDGVVIPMHGLDRRTIDSLIDLARRNEIRLVEVYDPAKIDPEVLAGIGTDRSKTLIVMAMRPEPADKFAPKFPKNPALEVASVNKTVTAGTGESQERGVSKQVTGDGFSGGESDSTNRSYALAVTANRIEQPEVLPQELVGLLPGQAVALTPDNVVLRTTLLLGDTPSQGIILDVLDPEDKKMLDDARTATVSEGGSQRPGLPAGRQRQAHEYGRLKSSIVRPISADSHGADVMLSRYVQELGYVMSVGDFLTTTREGVVYWNEQIAQNWRLGKEGKAWLEREAKRNSVEPALATAYASMKAEYREYAFECEDRDQKAMSPRQFYSEHVSERFPGGVSFLYRESDWPRWTALENSILKKRYAAYVEQARANGNRAASPREFYEAWGGKNVFNPREW